MSAKIYKFRPESPPTGELVEQGFFGSDELLVRGLREGSASAPAAFYDRYARYVERILVRVLGNDDEKEELLHEVFAEALSSIGSLKDPSKLRPWMAQISVFAARGAIRRRRRRRWLRLTPYEELELLHCAVDTEERITLRRVYAVLEKMRPEERIAFSLRRIEGMTLGDAASAMGLSLATFKRRLAKGEERFLVLAKRDPFLAPRARKGDAP